MKNELQNIGNYIQLYTMAILYFKFLTINGYLR